MESALIECVHPQGRNLRFARRRLGRHAAAAGATVVALACPCRRKAPATVCQTVCQTVPRLYFVRLTDHEHHQASCQPGTCTGCTRPAGATTVQFRQLETGAPTHAARLCLKPLNLCLETATMEPVSVHHRPILRPQPAACHANDAMRCFDALVFVSQHAPSTVPVLPRLCPDALHRWDVADICLFLGSPSGREASLSTRRVSILGSTDHPPQEPCATSCPISKAQTLRHYQQSAFIFGIMARTNNASRLLPMLGNCLGAAGCLGDCNV